MTREQKLERWAEREITRNINSIILEHQDGSILAFGTYDIRAQDNDSQVWQDNQLLGTFSTRAVALGWCVARKKHLLALEQEIEHLDRDRARIRDDIVGMRRARKKTQNQMHDDILESKIQHKFWYENMLNCRLEKCLMRAKYLQLRGFNNETARTRAS
jgi:hypothetical protein